MELDELRSVPQQGKTVPYVQNSDMKCQPRLSHLLNSKADFNLERTVKFRFVP
ncbi:hypothetical protein BaRGS_00039293, partial [Batillaria attramentaria]